jgi:hypothetical protein
MIKRIELKAPIQNGSELITELVFQPVKAKHIRLLPLANTNMNFHIQLAGTLTGTPPSVMDELSAEDTFQVIEVIENFFLPFLKIGAAN